MSSRWKSEWKSERSLFALNRRVHSATRTFSGPLISLLTRLRFFMSFDPSRLQCACGMRRWVIAAQVNALGEWIIGIYLHEFINNEREISIPHEAAECSISSSLLVNELLHHDNDVKEVVASEPRVTWYKSTNQKIRIRTVYESWIINKPSKLVVYCLINNEFVLFDINNQAQVSVNLSNSCFQRALEIFWHGTRFYINSAPESNRLFGGNEFIRWHSSISS